MCSDTHQEITEYFKGNSHLQYSQLGSSTSMPTQNKLRNKMIIFMSLMSCIISWCGTINLADRVLNGRHKYTPNIHQEFAKVIFSRFSVDFLIFQKLSKNSPGIFKKITVHTFYQKHFPEFYHFLKFSKNFETILAKAPL